jgi:CheY-like chemotaxis protein
MLSGLRVLIVEDVPVVRKLIRSLLELEGAVVMEACTGREAVEIGRMSDFDVVLTDLGLPDVPGEAVIAHIRAVSRDRTPVAVLSGASEPELARARDLGADRIFTKPLDWEDLLVYLERRALKAAAGVTPEATNTETERMRVLIIEDDSAMRALLEDVLERIGHRVIALADGTELPSVVERERFDVVILDKEMPGPNGLDLLSFLRHRRPAAPVIFVTAFGGPDVAEEAARRGAYSYLEKPFRVGTIIDTLAAVPRYSVSVEPDPPA